jgi:hypothetical protein
MSEELIQTDLADNGTSRRRMLAGMGVAAGGGLLALAGTQKAQAAVSDASYYSYGPVRYVDSRTSGGRIYGGDIRVLSAFAGLGNFAFAVNLTVVNTHGSGWLEIYNADLSTRPSPYSSINWQGDNKVVANFTMLDLGSAGAKIYCSGGSSTNTHFIIDVVGYQYNGGAAAVAVPAEVKAAEKKARRQLER